MAEHLADKPRPHRLQRVSGQVLLACRGLAGGSLNLIRLRPHPDRNVNRGLHGHRNPNRHHNGWLNVLSLLGNTESSRPVRVLIRRSVRAPVWSRRVTTFALARDRTMASKAVAQLPARVADDCGRTPSRNDSALPVSEPFGSRAPGSRACGAATKQPRWESLRRGSRGLQQPPCLAGFERLVRRTG